MEQLEFNFEEHEKMLSARYEQLAKFDAFDKLIDMALDGVITLGDAKAAWMSEEPYYGA